MQITVVTIFTEIFPGPMASGLSAKALSGLVDLRAVDIRDFAKDRHRSVDDAPYGGGPGMVLKPEVVHDAMEYALSLYGTASRPRIVFMSPRGVVLTQKVAQDLMHQNESGLIILCGRYEGIDQRVIDFWRKNHNMMEISIGDYILFGGEIPAIVLIDVCLRLIPGVLGNEESIKFESFSMDLLEYSHYTRPEVWMEEKVPSVLLSGNHEQIAAWRMENAKQITKDRRPDLLGKQTG